MPFSSKGYDPETITFLQECLRYFNESGLPFDR